MTFYYRPTVTEVVVSVQYIMTLILIASMTVLMMILDVFHVHLTSGFKKKHELTWVTSVILGVLTTSYGVTCYSLPRDWAVKIVTGLPYGIPVIGSPLVELLCGSARCGAG
ncbi:hypothetical protein MKW94_024160 [Papaver nudicaule]|uniref:Cytochrome b/b6 N-terminal region profile domain-containing protein n=1 Tax=Papaver nudicaule TaxID=74823 RepID=A0AA41SBE0_PAPNU|nr:hypothetical protein [Papaver nudicaule]